MCPSFGELLRGEQVGVYKMKCKMTMPHSRVIANGDFVKRFEILNVTPVLAVVSKALF